MRTKIESGVDVESRCLTSMGAGGSRGNRVSLVIAVARLG
jgi:hypothetical protein